MYYNILEYNLMGLSSCMRSVVDRNVVMRRILVICIRFFTTFLSPELNPTQTTDRGQRTVSYSRDRSRGGRQSWIGACVDNADTRSAHVLLFFIRDGISPACSRRHVKWLNWYVIWIRFECSLFRVMDQSHDGRVLFRLMYLGKSVALNWTECR
jgi:hypothetical protein